MRHLQLFNLFGFVIATQIIDAFFFDGRMNCIILFVLLQDMFFFLKSLKIDLLIFDFILYY